MFNTLKAAAIFLRAAVVLFGAAVLGFMLWLPPHEGRNLHATLFETYFKDPFLAYVYIGSLPFFWALWQAFKALGDLGRGEGFLPRTVKALITIRYCALATAAVVFGAAAYIRIAATGNDDPAGFVMPGLLAVFVFVAAAAAAFVLEKNIQAGAESGSGNDPGKRPERA